MRIVLRAGSGKDLVLCDGPESGKNKSRGPDGYGIDQTPANDVVSGARSAGVLPIPRGNATHQIAFGVARECGSHAEAIAWVNTHLRDLQALNRSVVLDSTKSLSLVLTAGSYSAAFGPGVLGTVRAPVFMGCSVRLQYQFIFGEML